MRDVQMAVDNEFYKRSLDKLYDGVYYVDRNRKIRYWNKAAERLTGYKSSEVVGKHCSDILTHINDKGVNLCKGQCPLVKTIGDGRAREADLYFLHKNGHRVPVSIRVAPIRDARGRIAGAVQIFSDKSPVVTVRQRLEQYEKMALLDPLTNSPNRRYIKMNLNSRLDEMSRYGWPFGILFIDIDHFKKVNDIYGHDVGDEILKMIAKTLLNNLRPFDLLGRWGGEEFTAIIANVNEQQFLAMYAPFLEQTSYNFLSYVHPLRRLGSLAISDVLFHSRGYEEVDATGDVIGRNKSIFKNAVIISYANRICRQLSLGASWKLIHEQVMRYSGNGQGIDLGILYQPLDELNVGLALQNVLQPKVTLRYDPEVYKINLKAGMALKTFFNHLILTADINKLVDEKAYFCAGLEVSPWENTSSPSLKRVDLRAGFNHLQTFTCGIGLKIKFFTIDYAFSSHDLGNLHKFALTFSWGNIYKASAKPILKSKDKSRFSKAKRRKK